MKNGGNEGLALIHVLAKRPESVMKRRGREREEGGRCEERNEEGREREIGG